MGRRNISTTKSGKYMNPTDQARKEARKRELKKNRKQRKMVRAAVLERKDPSQILIELEKMDILEIDAHIPPSHSVSRIPPGHNPNVLTAAPQPRPKDDKNGAFIIEAKAQIRNLRAEVTRFWPTALRVKRIDKKKTSKYTLEIPNVRPDAPRRPTKDDAYAEFMKEMQDLL